MWQIYALVALDLIKERRREAQDERLARSVVRGSAEARAAAEKAVRQAVLSTHRA
jgi:hypothetical protein